MSQNDLKTTSLMTSLTKNPQPQPTIFFLVQTRRLANPCKGLNSSLLQLVEELWGWYGNQKTLVLGRNPGKIYS